MTLTTTFLTLVGIYAIYIFYNMKMKRYLFVLCVLGVVGFVFGINQLETRNQKLTNQKFEYLYENGQYSEGTVLNFSKSRTGNVSSRTNINYSFISKVGDTIETSIGSLKPDFFDKETKKEWKLKFYEAKKKESYFVLYDSLNPQESILILNKPINKPNDIDKYIKEFKTFRKNK